MKTIKSDPHFIYKKNPPANFNKDDEFLLETKLEKEIPAMNLYHLEDHILFEDGSIFKGNKLVEESLRDRGMQKVYSPLRKFKNLFYKSQKIDSTVLSINDHWSHEYYHWFFEALPRLQFFLNEFKNEFTLVLSHRHKRSYIEESLKKFNIKNVLYLERKNKLHCKSLFFSDFAGPSDFHRKDLLLEIKKKFSCKEASQNVYISRSKARYRKIINEEEVISKLKEYNFKIVHAEDLSFEEQLNLFGQTKNLISIHGAGLTNILFLPENSNILEIRKNSWGLQDNGSRESSKFYNTYYHICDLSNLNYYYQNACSTDDNISCHYADLNVDIEELELNIKKMLIHR